MRCATMFGLVERSPSESRSDDSVSMLIRCSVTIQGNPDEIGANLWERYSGYATNAASCVDRSVVLDRVLQRESAQEFEAVISAG